MLDKQETTGGNLQEVRQEVGIYFWAVLYSTFSQVQHLTRGFPHNFTSSMWEVRYIPLQYDL